MVHTRHLLKVVAAWVTIVYIVCFGGVALIPGVRPWCRAAFIGTTGFQPITQQNPGRNFQSSVAGAHRSDAPYQTYALWYGAQSSARRLLLPRMAPSRGFSAGYCSLLLVLGRRWRRRRRNFRRALWARSRRRFDLQQFYFKNESRVGTGLRTDGAFAICKVRRNEQLIF